MGMAMYDDQGGRRWVIRECDPALADGLVTECGIAPLAARILVNRGITEPAAAVRFFSSTLADLYDPFLLLGMEAAVTRLATAAAAGETVCIYGDYDVDGITSVALLIGFFRAIGVNCFYHIPKRLEDGYGLAAEGIEAVAARGAKVIVTVDCGVTAVSEARLCKSLGVDLIITDHHMPAAEIPEALAVIDPLQPGCPFPFKQLAGVGVAFNLLVALRTRLREKGFFDRVGEPNLRQYLDLVALGTIADVVPLVNENRIFAKYGLQEMNQPVRTGISSLKNVAGITGPVSCGNVGFRLAPRLNAAGRLEDASKAVELLISDSTTAADALAETLDRSNMERQAIEQEILRDAVEMLQQARQQGRRSIVLASPEWHPGVIGIVASRLVDLYYLPTVLIAMNEGSGRGSGRSIPTFHLHDALSACARYLVKFGGHKYAAGLTISEDTLEEFTAMFHEISAAMLSEEDLVPELAIDAELQVGDVTMELARMIESLAPFGMGNSEPVFSIRGMRVIEQRILKDSHVKLRLGKESRTLDAIGFNMADRLVVPRVADVAFTLQKNRWNGNETLQLKLKDLKPA